MLSALQPAQLEIPDRIVSLLPPVPYGYDSDLTLISTPAGTAFDPVAVAHSLAQEIVDGLLHPQRAARMVSFNARNAANPGLVEVLTSLMNATWFATPAAGESNMHAALRRVTQRATLDALLDLAGSSSATPQVRAITEQQLSTLRSRIAAGGTGEERAHRATAVRDIDRYFDGRDNPSARPRPAPISLPWP